MERGQAKPIISFNMIWHHISSIIMRPDVMTIICSTFESKLFKRKIIYHIHGLAVQHCIDLIIISKSKYLSGRMEAIAFYSVSLQPSKYSSLLLQDSWLIGFCDAAKCALFFSSTVYRSIAQVFLAFKQIHSNSSTKFYFSLLFLSFFFLYSCSMRTFLNGHKLKCSPFARSNERQSISFKLNAP